jgi:hypothetical protein
MPLPPEASELKLEEADKIAASAAAATVALPAGGRREPLLVKQSCIPRRNWHKIVRLFPEYM